MIFYAIAIFILKGLILKRCVNGGTVNEAWTAAIGAIKTGMGDVMTTITTDTLLLALSFGFIFVRKGIGIVKKLIRIGGKS